MSPESSRLQPARSVQDPSTERILFRRRDWLAVTAVWAACSAALLVARPSYPFPPYELLDSWIYTAYQWDLRNQIADFGPTYYGSRLSWILPGALLHSWLPPVAAAIVFKLLFSAALSIACAGVVGTVADRRWALVTAAMATLTPQIIIALQTDYVDGPVIVFATVALLGITRAQNSRRWRGWIGLAGAALAAMLTTNVGAASTLGLALAVFHLLWLRWGVRQTLGAAVAYAGGAALLLLAVAGGSRWFGGELNFLQPQFDMLRYFRDVERNPWVPVDYEWLTRATWLILPTGAAIWATVRLAFVRGSNDARRALLLALNAGLITSLLASAVLEFRATGAVLSLYYYASFNLVFALPVLGLTAADHFAEAPLPRRWVAALIGAMFALVTVMTPVASWRILSPLIAWLGAPDRIPVVAAGALALLTLAFVAGRFVRRFAGGAGLTLLAGWLLLSLPTGMHGPEVSDRLRERYLAVHKAYFILKRELPNRSFRFWIDGRHRDGISLASTKLWGYRLLTIESFPQLGQTEFRDLTVVLPLAPGEGPHTIDRLHEVLKARHLLAENPRLLPVVGEAGTGFDLLLFELRGAVIDPELTIKDGPQFQMIAGYEYHRDPPYTARLGISRADGDRAAALDLTSGHAVFRRHADNDHLATDFQPLPASPPKGQRILALVIVMPADGDCTIEIQDRDFRRLGTVTLREAGRSVHNFEVPPEATNYRLCFFSRQQESTVLPININVYAVHPGVAQP